MSMSDKMFDTFKSKQMDNIKKVEFSIQKQVKQVTDTKSNPREMASRMVDMV